MAMNIAVIFADGSYGTILIQDLNELLEKKAIMSFCRSSGWVVPGRDELRSNRADEKVSWRDRKSNRLLLTI